MDGPVLPPHSPANRCVQVSTGLPYLLVPVKDAAALAAVEMGADGAAGDAALIELELHSSNHPLGMHISFYFYHTVPPIPPSHRFTLGSPPRKSTTALGHSASSCNSLTAWAAISHAANSPPPDRDRAVMVAAPARRSRQVVRLVQL